MNPGKNLIFQLPVNLPKTGATTLTLFVAYFSDMDPMFEWDLILCKGDYNVPLGSEDRIAFVRLFYQASTWGTQDPYAYVAGQVARLNADIATYFGGTTPVTIQDQIEDALKKLIITIVGNVPVVK